MTEDYCILCRYINITNVAADRRSTTWEQRGERPWLQPVEDLKLSQLCYWSCRSSWMWCCVFGWVLTDVSKDHGVSIFGVKQPKKIFLDSAWTWKWKQDHLPKRRKLLVQRLSAISKKDLLQRCCEKLHFRSIRRNWLTLKTETPRPSATSVTFYKLTSRNILEQLVLY